MTRISTSGLRKSPQRNNVNRMHRKPFVELSIITLQFECINRLLIWQFQKGPSTVDKNQNRGKSDKRYFSEPIRMNDIFCEQCFLPIPTNDIFLWTIFQLNRVNDIFCETLSEPNPTNDIFEAEQQVSKQKLQNSLYEQTGFVKVSEQAQLFLIIISIR